MNVANQCSQERRERERGWQSVALIFCHLTWWVERSSLAADVIWTFKFKRDGSERLVLCVFLAPELIWPTNPFLGKKKTNFAVCRSILLPKYTFIVMLFGQSNRQKWHTLYQTENCLKPSPIQQMKVMIDLQLWLGLRSSGLAKSSPIVPQMNAIIPWLWFLDAAAYVFTLLQPPRQTKENWPNQAQGLWRAFSPMANHGPGWPMVANHSPGTNSSLSA